MCMPLFHLGIVIFLFLVFCERLLDMQCRVKGPEEGPGGTYVLLLGIRFEKYPTILTLNFQPVRYDRRRSTEFCTPPVCYRCLLNILCISFDISTNMSAVHAVLLKISVVSCGAY
jgi:hypothetical protein